MKILITGSSGHLGEALIRILQNRKIDYVGIDIKKSAFTTKVGSITDRDFVKDCMKGVTDVLHTATLHKPHVATHSQQDFIDTNITGTLNLLEEAKLHDIHSFIYTSTTSTFGDLLTPSKNEPAIWVTEDLKPIPKNIYGITKAAAEDLCQLFYRNHQLPCLILKTSRFFPEEDDKKIKRDLYSDDNLKVNEYLNRRVDIGDAANAHLLAIEKAPEIGFGKYIISATTPFSKADLNELRNNAESVVERLFPSFKEIYSLKNWKMQSEMDRVYVNTKALNDLGWKPKYDFQYILACIKKGRDFNSDLSKQVGIKGYHKLKFQEGPYPVKD
ncbi:MAG: NAD(P)-dependent oxidoreductase [Flammeovirgaceae bacterium]|nr:NAD(P)-dependent oxidoreductase [Flammeovirgaceae bacterium]